MAKNDPLHISLRAFTQLLGWPGLEHYVHVIPPNARDVGENSTIEWYSWGSEVDVQFQINLLPSCHAAVYACRYRIWTGIETGT